MVKKLIKVFIFTTIIIMLVVIAVLALYIFKFKEADYQSDNSIKSRAKVENNGQTGILTKALPDAEVEEVLRGIIFIGDRKDANLISSAYFVNFDKQENKIGFYNFAGDLMIEVSNELYKELSTSIADLPQVLRLSRLYKYSKNKQGLKAGMLMLDNYFELGLSHYLFLRAEDADKIFYFNEQGESVFLQEFVTTVINGSDQDKTDFVNAVYNDKYTDIKKKTYVKLLKKLNEVKTENVKFITIKGERLDNGTIVNKDVLSQILSSEK